MKGIGGRTVANEFSVDQRSTSDRPLHLLEHYNSGSLTKD